MDGEKEMNYFEDQGLAVMIGHDAVLESEDHIHSGITMDSTNCINVADTYCSWLCPCEYFMTENRP